MVFISQTWQIKKVKPKFDDPRRDARMYKWLSHKYIKAKYSLWIDSNVKINVDIDQLIEEYLKDTDIALYEHNVRNCIYKEAEVCKMLKLDYPEIINKQIARYRAEGYPENNGLHATGIILRRHTEDIKELNKAVWKEIQNGSVRDQLCFDYVIWKLGIKVNNFDRTKHYFTIKNHKKDRAKYVSSLHNHI